MPTRLGHWLLPLLVGVSWATAEWGLLDWHRRSGYAILTVVLFRVFWGFFGSTTARFSDFVRRPSVVLSYARSLRERAGHALVIGHNPMGGWSVLALLTVLLVQTITGLFSVDTDGLESGPLSYLISFRSGRLLAEIHEISFNVLIGLVLLHLAAVAYYTLIRREALIPAMLNGRKSLPPDATQGLRFASPWRALVGIIIAVLVVLLIARGLRF
ncbi:Ni/Fe-hydrogenase 1 b-type cytochrome subunit [Sinimarinibacterium sp. CAU 1509]|nr:Ni/Fe-hydrogenase 1 b-type cytochrome subunit [Sinimarinibacterium sp. CAU 1509]